MARRKGHAPRWVQWLIVWVVVSGLGATGVMYLRSRGVLGDAAFAPVAALVCSAGARLETAYGSRDQRVDSLGRAATTGSRVLTYAALDVATCVAPDGSRTDARGRFTAAMLGLGGLAGGAIVGLLWVSQRR